MNEHTFPPSTNWYRSNILTCAEDGMLAYGTRNHIAIIKPINEGIESTFLKFNLIYNAHKEKVNAVVFSASTDSKAKHWHCICSASDDSQVKVWDCETQSLLLVNSTHGEGQKINCVDWSKADPNLIVSVDEAHKIVIWNIFSNTTHHYIVHKLNAFCVACCPHHKDIIAVGSNTGLVFVISTKGKVLYRLRGHDSEVVSLAWCPVTHNVLQPEKPNSSSDMLLASGAKSKDVYLWKTGNGGTYETFLNIPVNPQATGTTHRSRLGGSTGGGGNWICIAWPEPTTLLASSLWGELLMCDLNHLAHLKSKKATIKIMDIWKVVHAEHVRGIFSIGCSSRYWMSKDSSLENQSKNEEVGIESIHNGNEECIAEKITDAIRNENGHAASYQQKIIWTAAQDMQMVAYDWHSKKMLAPFSTIGGYVYCIAISPLDPNRIAFGIGDGTIRIWNVGAQNKYKMTVLWQKIGGKVMALAWHPTTEGLLAFGTSEGRIGLCYTLTGKPPVTFRTRHSCVYSLSWAPSVNMQVQETLAPENKLFLYSCAQGEILWYNPDSPEEDAVNLKAVLKPSDLNSKESKRSDFAWKPDYMYLAVGNEDGTVQIYELPDLKLRQTLFAHKKLIHSMAWHPECTAVDSGYSPYRNWLATSSNEYTIKVYDLSDIVESDDHVENERSLKVYSLNGHTGRIVCISWNPHIGGQLVSASYDGFVAIWNVQTQESLANFGEHTSCALCCAWSPLDPDLILSGSSDFTVRVWRVSNQKNASFDKTKAKKVTASKIAKPAAEADLGKNVDSHCIDVDDKKLQITSEAVNGNSNAEYAVAEREACSTGDSQRTSGKNIKKKPTSSRAFFPISYHEEKNLENCYKLLEAFDKQNSTACDDMLDSENQAGLSEDLVPEDVSLAQPLSIEYGFFGDQQSMQKVIDLEVKEHQKTGKIETMQHMELWRGNVTEMLREAARKKKLNDWLVSLAPMASQKVWMEMCNSYAEQLIICGNYHKASTYLLACHKVEEAIETLTKHKLFREAIAIAGCRLGPEDPTIDKIISQWAAEEVQNGNFETATLCFIKLRQLPEAVKCLRKRKEVQSLKLAAFIAKKAEMNEMATILTNQCMCQSLLEGNFDVASQIASEHPKLKHLKLLMSTYKVVLELRYLNESPKIFAEYVLWIKGNLNSNSQPLLQLIVKQWNTEHDKTDLEQIHSSLEKEFQKSQTAGTREELCLAVSKGLALACVSSEERRVQHICAVLSVCYQHILLHPAEYDFLLCLCIWLSPEGPSASDSVFSAQPSTEHSKRICSSLKAYLCAALVEWMAQYLESRDEKSEDEGAEQWVVILEFLKTCKDDVLSLESMQYFQDCVKIKKLEKDVAAYIAKVKQSSSASETSIPNPEENGIDELQIDDKTSKVVLKKFQELKERKENFEQKQISSPNPFIIYCKIKNILERVTKYNPLLVNNILNDFELSWKHIMELTASL